MSQIIGINPNLTKAGTSDAGVGAEYDLGTIAKTADGAEWMYVQATEAISQYMVAAAAENGQASKATSALALDQYTLGAAQVAFAQYDFGWILLDPGQSNSYKVGVLSACDADAFLNTSGTAGYLDDAYTTFVPLLGWTIATTVATTGGGTIVANGRLRLVLRTSGV